MMLAAGIRTAAAGSGRSAASSSMAVRSLNASTSASGLDARPANEPPVRVTPEAEAQLEEIIDYIAADSDDAARRVLSGIHEALVYDPTSSPLAVIAMLRGTRESVRAATVTYPPGMKCYLCLRYGPNPIGGEAGIRTR
jgi:hypothetical protein